MKHYRHIFLALFLFALPWQTRWIIETVTLFGGESQYGHLSLYAFDVLLLAYLALSVREWNVFRWRELRAKRPVAVALYASLTLCVMSFLSILWSVQPIAALAFALHLAGAVLLFATLLLDRDVKAQMILVPLAAGIVAPALLAWYQSLVQSISASTVLGIAAQDPATPGVAVVEVEGGRWLRAYGSFPHPNMLAGFAAVSLVAVFASIVQYARSNVLKMASAVTSGLALVLTVSRAGMAAALSGVAAIYLCLYQSSYVTSFREMLKTLILVILVMTAAGATLAPVFVARANLAADLEEQSVEERQSQLTEARELLTRNAGTFLFGVGGGNYTFALEEARPLREVWEYQPVHNVPMLVWTELGIVGLLALAALFVSFLWGMILKWESPAGASVIALSVTVLILSLFDHYLWTQAAGVYLLFAVFAAMQKLREETL